MHIPRFFLTPRDLYQTNDSQLPTSAQSRSLDLPESTLFKIVNPAILNQVRNVLRLKNGARLIILDGCGQMYNCTLQASQAKELVCLVEQKIALSSKTTVQTIIGLPLLKGDRFDWALQKLTELGVHKIVPLETARSVVKVDTEGDAKGVSNKIARWQAILKEAAEQSERETIPDIVQPQKIENFIRDFATGGTIAASFICAERLSTLPLRDILLDHVCGRRDLFGTAHKTISVIVGPEGGLTENEITIAQEQGFVPVSLGPRILRAETAAIFSVAQIIWALEK